MIIYENNIYEYYYYYNYYFVWLFCFEELRETRGVF